MSGQLRKMASSMESCNRVRNLIGPRLSLDRSLGMGLVVPTIMRRTVVGRLKAPTDLAFSNDGVLFYTERDEGLFAIRSGGDAALLFAPPAMALLAVTVDPDFDRNRRVYALAASRMRGTDSMLASMPPACMTPSRWCSMASTVRCSWGSGKARSLTALHGFCRAPMRRPSASDGTQASRTKGCLGVGFKAVAQGPDALYVVTSGRPGGEGIWRLSAQ